MRSARLIILLAMFAAAAAAQTSEDVIGKETAKADQAKEEVEPKTVATADAAAPDEVKLPPGFRVKKRGDITLYCIRGKATGTRFQTESCYDKARLQDYLLAREQNNRDFDQARAVCQNPKACGMP